MADAATVRVACAQIAPVVADPEANRQLAARAIAEARRAGAQIIVLPELMTTGYHLEPEEAVSLAEEASGPSVNAWIEALAGSEAIVVGGFCERGEDGTVLNSAAMVDAAGVLAVYRKTHLWAEEPQLFVPGTQPPPVVETRWGPVGMAICYDLFFPELTRGLALNGAHILVVPTNSPWEGSREVDERAPDGGIGHAIARTAAYVNRVWVAVCDRHGDERGSTWTSRSSIISPEGDLVAGPVSHAEALLLADCDLADAARKQWDGTDNDAFRDRRSELYGAVTEAR